MNHPSNPGARIGLDKIQAAVGDSYLVLSGLWSGGMSRVFLAEETRLSRQIVIRGISGWYEIAAIHDCPGQVDSATAFERVTGSPTLEGMRVVDGYALAPGLKPLGERWESRGNRRRAADYSGRFVDLWRNADPELQPAVREVWARPAQPAREPGE